MRMVWHGTISTYQTIRIYFPHRCCTREMPSMIRPMRRMSMVRGSPAPSAVLMLSLCTHCPPTAASVADPDDVIPTQTQASPSFVLVPAISDHKPGPLGQVVKWDSHTPALFEFLLPQSTAPSRGLPPPPRSEQSSDLLGSKSQPSSPWTLRLTKARLFRLDARQSAPLAFNADQESEKSAGYADPSVEHALPLDTHQSFAGMDDEFGIEDLANFPTADRPFEPSPSFHILNNPPLTLNAPSVRVLQAPRLNDHGLTPLTPGTSIWKLPLSDTLSLDGRGWQRQIDQNVSVLIVGAEAKVGLSDRVDLRMGYELLRSASDSLGLSSEGEGEGVYAQFRFRF